jgi:predicted lipoprotein with Yx(FWY)xxD motif
MKIPTLLAVGAVSVLTLTACGSSSSAPQTAAAPGTSSSAAGLHLASTSLGRVVVDAQGRTVYLLTADTHDHATCDAGCQQYWPPVASGRAAGLSAKVGTTALPGGGTTATVAGWPVYTYVGDHQPGDVSGEGVRTFGGTWYALSAAGTPVRQAAGSSASSSPAYQPHTY